MSCSLSISRRRSNECDSKSTVNAGTFGSFKRLGFRRPQPKHSSRMLDRIDKLGVERDRLKKELGPVKGKALGGRSW
jgi:hypothetical protein